MSNYDQADFYFKRAQTAKKNFDHQKMIEMYTKAIDFCKDEHTAEKFLVLSLLDRAGAYYATDEYEKCIDDCDKVIEISPNKARVWELRGDCYYMFEDYDKAIDDFGVALELDPEYSSAHYGMAITYEKKKEYKKGLKHILECVAIKTRNGDEKDTSLYWATAGKICIELRKYDDAIRYLLKSTNVATMFDSRPWLYLGSAYRLRNSLGDLDRALVVLNKSIDIFANDKDAWIERGKVYEQMGEKTKAENDFREAQEADNRLMVSFSELDEDSIVGFWENLDDDSFGLTE